MKMRDTHGRHKFRRGIYLLPNLFTTLNLFCGFYAVIAAINGKFLAAAISIVIAGLFDNLDGKIARATKTTSQFGVEYDSLADLISFGFAPGLLIYLWALQPLGRIGWLAAFLFVVCGALRLARFNTQVGSVSSDYFIGLPIPGGAGMCAVTVLFCHKIGIENSLNPLIILVTIYLLSFLMVSSIQYNSFKRPELFKTMNFNSLVTAVLIFIFIAAQPSIALFMFGVIYTLSGPFNFIRHSIKRKHESTDENGDDKESSHTI
ncbi:MAG: CDP-diacylglycerol--serine O-phosphatidyltransferase [Desulfobacteraceae bacterium]|nr:CDP-diacylglycerol--serine O-phosphatidyltransferase [Desulfobacteraceae bacterium]